MKTEAEDSSVSARAPAALSRTPCGPLVACHDSEIIITLIFESASGEITSFLASYREREVAMRGDIRVKCCPLACETATSA
jgi:hypothetical protein